MIAMEGIAIISLLLLKYSKRINISIPLSDKRIISVALLAYGILFVYWLTNIDSIKDDIYKIFAFPGALYSVPISIFPELLGLAGFLSIPVMVLLLRKNNRTDPLVIFPIIFIGILIVGRIISYVNINIQSSDYWERRLVPYLWISVSILSSIAVPKLINLLDRLKLFGRNFTEIRVFATIFVIFFLVLGAMLSTFLTLEYSSIVASISTASENEKTLLNELTEVNPNSTILTATPRSQSLAEFQHFNYNIGYYGEQIWPSVSPELPMNILSGLNSTAIIYMPNKDMDAIIRQGYDDAYVASHLLQIAPDIGNNSSLGKIIQIPRLSPPTSSSDMVLVLPNEISKSQYFAYDILSLGQYNYTSALPSDISTLKNAKILVAPSEEIANNIIEFRDIFKLNFENLIILNSDGYGQIGQLVGELMNPTFNYTDWIQYKYKKNDTDNSQIAYARLYDNPVDLSTYDLIKFDWIGQGKNEYHTIEFSSKSGGSIKYQFKDTWKGSKELILPMNITKDLFKYNGVDINGEVVDNISWSDISRIEIFTSNSFPGPDPNINLDAFEFVSDISTGSIKSISNGDTLRFNPVSIIPSTYPSSYQVSSTFDNNVPFILQRETGNYSISYINIFPLIQNLDNNKLSPVEMYSLYGRLLDNIGIDLPIYNTVVNSPSDLVKGHIASFSNGIFTGNVTMQSTYAQITTNTANLSVNVDGNYSTLNDLSRIIPLNIDRVKINSNSSTISGIYGFYTLTTSPHNTTVSFIGNPAVVSLIYENNHEKLLYGGNITITLDNAKIISRQPDVFVNGSANFSQFYSYGELNDIVGSLGSDLESQGQTSFTIKYADKFMLSEDTQFSNPGNLRASHFDNGNVNLINLDNLLKVDTFASILLLVILFCLYNFYITRRNT
jgi:hypothetical protein